MNRITQCFSELGSRRALISFVTAGDPTLAHTVPALHALVRGGVNILELGVPFSDPEAEGPAIQASSERALANGVQLKHVLEMVSEFRKDDGKTPIVLMGYLNSFLAMDEFAARAATAGVDGLIIVNLPPEESLELRQTLEPCGIDLIFLIAPTTTEARCKLILKAASGFVYYVSLKGITGADHVDAGTVRDKVQALKQYQDSTKVPICVGFGIKDAQTAKAIGEHASGVVVGSALVNLMAEHPTDVEVCASALQASANTIRLSLDEINDR